MTIQQAVQILEQHNKWLRAVTDPIAMTDPKALGIAIDTIVAHFKSHNAKEPPPKAGKVNVTEAVIADIAERSKIGTEKYGTPLMTHNGRKPLVDAYQEILDMAVYVKQELLERSEQ